MSRRIAIVTGTRAEYGLLKGLIRRVHDAEDTELQLLVTGSHLAPEFGMTVNEIEQDGLPISERIEILLSSDSAVGVAKATALGLIGLAEAYRRLDPDLVVVLGDRYEILAAAAAALFSAIPIAHIHGGESTEGAFDEAIRHSVTKMAHLHFTAAEPYRRRVIQLGEDPARVFNFGALGLDAVAELTPIPRDELERQIGFTFGDASLLVTFHPETAEDLASGEPMGELLAALDTRPELNLLFTLPNADRGGRAVIELIQDYVARRPNAVAHASLGQHRYLSALRYVSGVVGNSSSGLIEAPSCGVGTLNIGGRQAGRLQAASVLNAEADRTAIAAALTTLLSAEFRALCANVENPNGMGRAAERIFEVLRHHPLDGLLRKRFHDLPVDAIEKGPADHGH